MNHSKKESIELTRNEAIGLHTILSQTNFKEPISNIFRKMCTNNIKTLEEVVSGYAIDEAFPILETAHEYNSKLKEIEIELRDEIIKVEAEYGFSTNDDYVAAEQEVKDKFLEDTTKLRESYGVKIDALKEEYSDVITEQESINKDRDVFLSETESIELITLVIDELPQYDEFNGNNKWSMWQLLDKITFYANEE